MGSLANSPLLDNLTPGLITALKDFPIGQPPDGVKADYEHRQFHGHQILIIGCVSLAILLVFLLVRIYAKVFVFKQITLDDYIYWIGWPSGAIYVAVAIVVMGTKTGIFGYHVWDVHLGEVTVRIMMNARTLSILYGPLQWLQKLTLFSMLHDIFSHIRYMRFAIYSGAVISGLMYISNSIISGVYCGPQDGNDIVAYLKGLASPECAGNGIVLRHGIATGAMTVLVDIYILCLPLSPIWKLNMSAKKKLGVMMVFLAGIGACVCSILTLWYRISYANSKDITYALVPVTTSIIFELTVGLAIPCTAPFVRLYRHYFDKPISRNYTHPTGKMGTGSSNKSSNKSSTQERHWGNSLNDDVELIDTLVVVDSRSWPGDTQMRSSNRLVV